MATPMLAVRPKSSALIGKSKSSIRMTQGVARRQDTLPSQRTAAPSHLSPEPGQSVRHAVRNMSQHFGGARVFVGGTNDSALASFRRSGSHRFGPSGSATCCRVGNQEATETIMEGLRRKRQGLQLSIFIGKLRVHRGNRTVGRRFKSVRSGHVNLARSSIQRSQFQCKLANLQTQKRINLGATSIGTFIKNASTVPINVDRYSVKYSL